MNYIATWSQHCRSANVLHISCVYVCMIRAESFILLSNVDLYIHLDVRHGHGCRVLLYWTFDYNYLD